MRTRKEMEEIIRGGRSVYGADGVLYSNIGQLPSEAELAKGNKEAEDAARRNIKQQLSALASQLALLDDNGEDDAKSEPKKAADKPAAKAEEKAPAKAEDKKDDAK